MDFIDEAKVNATEVIDGNRYEQCRFEKCRMIYRGGEIPTIKECRFDDCSWHFEDAAERTLLLLRQLYHGMGPGGRALVESTLSQLRQPLPAQPEPPPDGG